MIYLFLLGAVITALAVGHLESPVYGFLTLGALIMLAAAVNGLINVIKNRR